MLLRVVRRLLSRPGLEHVLVNIDRPDLVEALGGEEELRRVCAAVPAAT